MRSAACGVCTAMLTLTGLAAVPASGLGSWHDADGARPHDRSPQDGAGSEQDAPPQTERRRGQPAIDAETLEARLRERRAQLKMAIERVDAAMGDLEDGRGAETALRSLFSDEGGSRAVGMLVREWVLAEPERGWRGPPNRRSEQRAGRNDDAPRDAQPTQEEVKQFREFAADHLPSMDAELRRYESERPEFASRMLERMAPWFRETIELERRDPELFGVRLTAMNESTELFSLIRRLRSNPGETLSDADRNTLRARARAAFEGWYDERLTVLDRDLTKANSKTEELQSELESMRERRDEAIEERITQLFRRLENGRGDRRPERGPGRDGPRGLGRDRD